MEVLFDQHESLEDTTGQNYYIMEKRLQKYGRLCFHLGMESYYLIPNSEFIKVMTETFPDEKGKTGNKKRKELVEYIANISDDLSCSICVTHPIFFDIHLLVIVDGKKPLRFFAT